LWPGTAFLLNSCAISIPELLHRFADVLAGLADTDGRFWAMVWIGIDAPNA
jgi:hypothetical protein